MLVWASLFGALVWTLFAYYSRFQYDILFWLHYKNANKCNIARENNNYRDL